MLISLSPDLNDTDQSEETAALVDLVETGANLLRTVDSLLKDVRTFNEISHPKTECALPRTAFQGKLMKCVTVSTIIN